jgi:hypothetical protein
MPEQAVIDKNIRVLSNHTIHFIGVQGYRYNYLYLRIPEGGHHVGKVWISDSSSNSGFLLSFACI